MLGPQQGGGRAGPRHRLAPRPLRPKAPAEWFFGLQAHAPDNLHRVALPPVQRRGSQLLRQREPVGQGVHSKDALRSQQQGGCRGQGGWVGPVGGRVCPGRASPVAESGMLGPAVEGGKARAPAVASARAGINRCAGAGPGTPASSSKGRRLACHRKQPHGPAPHHHSDGGAPASRAVTAAAAVGTFCLGWAALRGLQRLPASNASLVRGEKASAKDVSQQQRLLVRDALWNLEKRGIRQGHPVQQQRAERSAGREHEKRAEAGWAIGSMPNSLRGFVVGCVYPKGQRMGVAGSRCGRWRMLPGWQGPAECAPRPPSPQACPGLPRSGACLPDELGLGALQASAPLQEAK